MMVNIGGITMQYTIPENAIITSINPNYLEKQDDSYMEGLCITTDKGNIKLFISLNQHCCENWGAEFLETPDDTSKHIGATLLSVEDTPIPSPRGDDPSVGETQLRVTTSAGVIQYAIYNSPNSDYYCDHSHATFLQVFDTVENSTL